MVYTTSTKFSRFLVILYQSLAKKILCAKAVYSVETFIFYHHPPSRVEFEYACETSRRLSCERTVFVDLSEAVLMFEITTIRYNVRSLAMTKSLRDDTQLRINTVCREQYFGMARICVVICFIDDVTYVTNKIINITVKRININRSIGRLSRLNSVASRSTHFTAIRDYVQSMHNVWSQQTDFDFASSRAEFHLIVEGKWLWATALVSIITLHLR